MLDFSHDAMHRGAAGNGQVAVDRDVANDGEVKLRAFPGALAVDGVSRAQLQHGSGSDGDGAGSHAVVGRRWSAGLAAVAGSRRRIAGAAVSGGWRRLLTVLGLLTVARRRGLLAVTWLLGRRLLAAGRLLRVLPLRRIAPVLFASLVFAFLGR